MNRDQLTDKLKSVQVMLERVVHELKVIIEDLDDKREA